MSAMVIHDVVSQHAEEAAFLWTSRTRAVSDPTYDLKALCRLDDRVEAHLDGLRIAGEAAWSVCRTQLDSGGAGEVFPLAVLAFEAGDRQRMLDALLVGCVSVETRRALISALGWLDYRSVSPWIEKLLQAKTPVHRSVGIAACAIHRVDPGAMLTAALSDPDPMVRARSVRAVGELKRADLLGEVRKRLADDDEACRFWTAWTLTLHGDRAGVQALRQWFGHGNRFGVAALQLALRSLNIDEGRDWIRPMAKDPELRNSAIVAAGVLGDPVSVPWVIGHMRSPGSARLAGEAFSMITGVDLTYRNLDRNEPAETEEAAEAVATPTDAEYENHLPWPDPELVDRWWHEHESQFTPGVRYQAGKPVTVGAAREILLSGTQRQRAAAAIELAIHEPDEPLFEIRSRAALQQRRLAQGVRP
jgi:uncharacterized protein (TIGR02270 family)